MKIRFLFHPFTSPKSLHVCHKQSYAWQACITISCLGKWILHGIIVSSTFDSQISYIQYTMKWLTTLQLSNKWRFIISCFLPLTILPSPYKLVHTSDFCCAQVRKCALTLNYVIDLQRPKICALHSLTSSKLENRSTILKRTALLEVISKFVFDCELFLSLTNH